MEAMGSWALVASRLCQDRRLVYFWPAQARTRKRRAHKAESWLGSPRAERRLERQGAAQDKVDVRRVEHRGARLANGRHA